MTVENGTFTWEKGRGRRVNQWSYFLWSYSCSHVAPQAVVVGLVSSLD